MEHKRATVFISYSSADSVFADLVKMKLNEAGIEVWIDEDIPGGEQWRNEIDLGISNADVLLLILTEKSQASPYVTYEWAYAIGRKKKIIPLLHRTTEVHPRLSVYHHLDFTEQRKGPWDKLISQINQISREVKETSPESRSIGNLTEGEFIKLMSGIISLANASAYNEKREVRSDDFSEAARNMAHASLNMEQTRTVPATILWVDDKPDNNIREREAFVALGFRFDLAASTREAIVKKSRGDYSAIISDMRRREGPREGYVLLEEIRKSDKATPYFIYGATNSTDDKREAARLGAQGLTNNPRELIDLVISYVSVE